METIRALLHDMQSTSLKDRQLWWDGESSFNSDELFDVVQKYNVKYITHINEVVQQYNMHVSTNSELKVKLTCNPLNFDWNLPNEYDKLDVNSYVFDKFIEQTKQVTDEEFTKRARRLSTELEQYAKYNLVNVLRAVIYIINTLTEHNIIWGVGRGSSVSSYVLYILGVHDVDSYAYDLNIEDFLHS